MHRLNFVLNPSDKFMCKYADENQNFVGYFFIFSASMPCIALKKKIVIIREKKILSTSIPSYPKPRLLALHSPEILQPPLCQCTFLP